MRSIFTYRSDQEKTVPDGRLLLLINIVGTKDIYTFVRHVCRFT